MGQLEVPAAVNTIFIYFLVRCLCLPMNGEAFALSNFPFIFCAYTIPLSEGSAVDKKGGRSKSFQQG